MPFPSPLTRQPFHGAPMVPPFGPDVRNPFLKGNYGPVADEMTEASLEVIGELPAALNGLFVRNGPNPLDVHDPAKHHWFIGDGMVHGIKLSAGKANWYRNRYVKTDRVAHLTSQPEFGGARSPVDSVNTHVQAFAGRIYALVESGPLPMILSEELETLGYSDFGGQLERGFAAHPHVDPLTGHWLALSYEAGLTNTVTYLEFSETLSLVTKRDIAVADGPMIHDFAFSKRFALIPDLPITWRQDLWDDGYNFPYRWNSAHPARVGLLSRTIPQADIIWCPIDPCYVFHFVNAFDDDAGNVVVDAVVFDKMFDKVGVGPADGPSRIERWTISPDGSPVRREIIDSRIQEFPRIDERLTGQQHCQIYSAGIQSDRGSAYRFDTVTGLQSAHDHGPLRFGSECVFVPRGKDAPHDEGWVLTLVWDAQRNSSELTIIDTRHFEEPPVARIMLPQRVPFGFHGSWIPAS
jgi:8'-apo-carotenoid 13,14-cleaving dioxygenase